MNVPRKLPLLALSTAKSVSALALVLSVIAAPLHAQDVFNNWNSTSNTSWGTATNWTQGTVPNNISNIVQIGTASNLIGTIDLDATNYTIKQLYFHFNNIGAYTLQNGTLTINANSASDLSSILGANTKTNTINANIILSNSLAGRSVINQNSAGQLIINGNITAAGTNGAHELRTTATNSSIIVNGNINVTSPNEFYVNGSGLVTLAGSVTGTPTTRVGAVALKVRAF